MIILKNPAKPYIAAIDTDGLVDTNSIYLCIPEYVRQQLQLESRGSKEVVFRDGSKETVPYVGPVEVQFKSRVGFVGALVLGSEVLLGALPMEEMDLVEHLQIRSEADAAASEVSDEEPSYGSFAVVRNDAEGDTEGEPALTPSTPQFIPTLFPQVLPEPSENLRAVGE